LSTLVSSPASLPQWKQEVNRRLAEHKNRRGISVVERDDAAETSGTVNSRAAAAAARVAARYAKAPSFSEMQAAEARAALRLAEAATRVALDAQAAAQVALDKLGTTVAEVEDREDVATGALSANRWQDWQPAEAALDETTVHARVQMRAMEQATDPAMEIRWESDMPAFTPTVTSREADAHPTTRDDWWETVRNNASTSELSILAVEPAEPIHANLIEFPRELIATRRMRPRIAEAQCATVDEYGQLSIFEVDPTSISIDPAAPAMSTGSAQNTWCGTAWTAIELDAQPRIESEYQYEAPSPRMTLHQAPFGLRMMATTVDLALVLGAVCGVTLFAATELPHFPAIKTAEFLGIAAVIALCVLYQGFFLYIGEATPGMRWAQISWCTFDDEYPSREERRGRLVAMLVSLLPMGLGALWAIFDEDRMCWHDRLSRTYLRKC